MTERAGSIARTGPARFARGYFFFGCVMLTGLVATSSFAQVLPPVFDPTLRSGEPPLKKIPPPPVAPPGTVLPPAPRPPETDTRQQLGQVRVFVHDIHVVGSTVFTDAEIDEVTKPYKGRTLTTEDLERLRVALTLLYVNRGYITSGAVIPDQDVTLGTITIQIIEGTLARLDVEGTDWFQDSYLRDRVELGVRKPLAIAPLQERLQLLQQDSRLERINAELRPGERRGESTLNLRVKEASPWKAWIDLNNHQPPVVGAERGLATIAHQNLTGHGDPFSFTYGRSRGVTPIIDTAYTLPITRYDTTVTGYYRRNDFLVIDDAFRFLDLKADAEIIGVTLRQPLYRTLTDEFAVAITGERLYNKITTAEPGLAQLFIPGSSDTGVNTVSALRFIQEYVHRTSNSVIAARSRFTVGLNVLGATNNSGPVPDTQFFAWLGQIQGIRRVDEWGGVQFMGHMSLQLANDRLFPLEQVPVGGRFSVRGYRENTLIRDNAFLATVESRIPLVTYPTGEPRVQFAQFVDLGRSWNAKGGTPDPETLASVGLGLRWTVLPQQRAWMEVYWGLPLNYNNVHRPEGDARDPLQDNGLHVQIVVQVL
ncbi:putative Surface antigen (D15) [Nitrospira moscoviensis]|uniref:Putative Surface antigen (D15) n=2 Tax=Nitrospira moscoviensis TaxID=42253 RepID=A0A0K2GEB4_NITMO|nr:putative Surface antigen (D15) [Nitrospira moscoviensis]